MMQILLSVILLLLLFALAMIDFKTGKIPLLLVSGGAAAGLALQFFALHASWSALLPGLIPGIVLLLLSAATKQAVGYGDGAAFLMAGIFLGLESTVLLFFLSLLFAGLASVILLIARKRKKTEQLPFLPFAYAGYVALLALL